VDVGGVGYRVHCSRRTLDALPPAGEAVTLQTEMIVREDQISLVGFLDPAEADWYAALNGGPNFRLGEAVSFMIPCETQADIDRLWDALTADGGQEMDCGWAKDRFGQAWQIVPARLMEILRSGEGDSRTRAFGAMMTMKKLNLAAIEAAYIGEG